MSLEWMAWTLPTAIFFIGIVLILIAMTVWQVVSPSLERRGFLLFTTTPGDRLFVGLLSSAYFHLIWLGVTDLNIWYVFLFSILWLIVVIRWG